MYLKKINIIYLVISLINIILFFQTINFTKYESDFCLISDISHNEAFSQDKDTQFKNIKSILQNEVIDLERQRQSLINEILSKKNELSKLHNEVYQYSIKSHKIRNSIISLAQIRKDFQRRHRNSFDFKPVISKFKDVSTSINYSAVLMNTSDFIDLRKCSIFSCFNFQNCVYNKSDTLKISLNISEEGNIFFDTVKKSQFYSTDNSCITLVFNITAATKHRCKNENCVLIDTHHQDILYQKSIISNYYFQRNNYRNNFDIVIPVFLSSGDQPSVKLPMIYPLKRRYLLSFTAAVNLNNLPKLDLFVLKYFQNISDEIQKETGYNNLYFDVNCMASNTSANFTDWSLCENSERRLKRLAKSKFCLILSHWNIDIITTKILQQRLYECLLTGSIPVILGDIALPFEEIIDWKKAVLVFPKQRVVEVVNIIQNVPDNDIFQIKLFSRQIFELHFLNLQHQIESIGYVLTKRMGLALPLSAVHKGIMLVSPLPKSLYNFTLPNLQMEMDPYLGPNNIPATNSVNFAKNNVRSFLPPFISSYYGANFHVYPSTPWDPALPTDSVLRGYSTRGYYGINHSNNEAGTEFMHSLGGNHVYEQFTLLILSYKRHSMLRKSLEMLKGLPYLHSIVVVWNDPSLPPTNFKWPKLHVDIKVVKSQRNSLNNRFLPYDIIETDAVLSFDDDIQLRHDEIVFAFRVWRENRDRIVGFPARYHNEYSGPAKVRYTNDQWWMYNSNYTCEYSMILTGAAFFHRFYLFAYSNDMNPAIRDIVDKYQNCEDIAMNFLVSHVTRKPPLKVTVRWTFSCVNCDSESENADESLHNRPNHYQIRSNCINEFSAIYGYNSLLYSQYRADSVLFKTRLPVDKQKCFRYV